MKVSRVEVPDVDHKPLVSESNSVRSFLIVFCHAQGGIFEEPLPVLLDVALLSFVVEEQFS